MKKRKLIGLSFLVILVTLVTTGYALKKHYRAHITITPEKTVVQIRDAQQMDVKFNANQQANSFRKKSVPTECLDEKAPSICSGNHDVVKTDVKQACKCTTTIDDKTFVKEYDVKSVYEYELVVAYKFAGIRTFYKAFNLNGKFLRTFKRGQSFQKIVSEDFVYAFSQFSPRRKVVNFPAVEDKRKSYIRMG